MSMLPSLRTSSSRPAAAPRARWLSLLLLTALLTGCVVHSHARARGRVAVRPAAHIVVR